MKELFVTVMRNVWQMKDEFFGTGIYLILFLVSVFFFAAMEKDKKKQHWFLGYTGLFAVIYACPVTAGIIMKYCIGKEVYWRMFWLLPITVMIAYMFTCGIAQMKGHMKKLLVLLLVVISIAVTAGSHSVYRSGVFEKGSNPYKLNQDILVVCDAIEADAASNGIEEKGVIVPAALSAGIRQYDAAIRMPYGRNALRGEKLSKLAGRIYWNINADRIDAQALAFYAYEGSYPYLVYRADADSRAQIEAAGYTMIADVGNYYIYRLTDDAMQDSDWLITQYGHADGNQQMFYTMQDHRGHLVVVDGGWVDGASEVRTVIETLGNHVDDWLLTHPHDDHIGAFCEIYDAPGSMKIDHVYAVDMASPELCLENASWDGVDMYRRFLSMDISQLEYVHSGDEISVGDTTIDILSAYEDKIDELSNDLQNDGAMMFRMNGKSETMLFCSDVGKHVSDYLLEKYKDTLKADYLQMGHHGNGGLKADFYEQVHPRAAFFDAPDWLMEDERGIYTTPANKKLMEDMGSEVRSFSTAPNSLILR